MCHDKGAHKGDADVNVQLDDMRMPESTHVLDLALDTGLGLGHMNDGLGDVLHGDPLSSDGMGCHCQNRREKGEEASTEKVRTIASS